MNKIVAVLGIIVLMTLSGLFFCVGFFTGTTIFPSRLSMVNDDSKEKEKALTLKDIEDITDVKSPSISEKVMGILATAAESASETMSMAMSRHKIFGDDSKVTVDSLLREMAASHSPTDDCSYDKSMTQVNAPAVTASKSLDGKKIVFIGYFKNNIAAQIQKLLTGKGYKAHVERSKSGDGSESFVFCGPFKKDESANNLVTWLQKHDFSEARTISVSSESMEEILYDFINDDSSMPENVEKEIPEMDLSSQNATTSPTATPTTKPAPKVDITLPTLSTIATQPQTVVPPTPTAASVTATPTPASAAATSTPVPTPTATTPTATSTTPTPAATTPAAMTP
ncbi:MAG: hypothetical protein LBB29_01800 [Holosporaceae bacterium]|nr:hypothetical protein [Holosporaceae bacterium]